MLRANLLVRPDLCVVEAGVVSQSHGQKRAELLRFGQAEHFGEEPSPIPLGPCAPTMVWLNVIAIPIQSTTGSRVAATMHDGAMSDVEVLDGPRVTLRAPTLDDAEPLFERMASDPDVSRYMSWRPHRDVRETRRVDHRIVQRRR